jgi:CRP-like cAMP-binding protein
MNSFQAARTVQAASPLYVSQRKLAGSQRSMSLREVMKQNGSIESFSMMDSAAVEEAPVLLLPALSPMAKFNRALKRIEAARRIGVSKSNLLQTPNSSIISYLQIKKLISRPEVRHDVVFITSPTDTYSNSSSLHNSTGKRFQNLTALRANSFGMIIWNLIQVILLIYILIFIPFRLSFANIDNTSCRKDIVLEGVDLFLDTFYLLDLVVSACTQSVSDQGLPLLLLKDTVPHYVLSWVFVRDVAPAIPMSWIDYAQKDEDCSTSTTVSNAHITKLLRIMRIFRILRVFKLFNVKFISDALRNVDPNMKTLASLFAALLVTVHLLASIWFFVKKDSSSISDWYIEQGLDSGANRSLRVYLSCVYYIVATLATVGYGDISADHADERILSIGIMLLGTVIFALIISTASMVVQNANMDDAAHGSKIAWVHEFCSKWQLNEDLKYEILDFFLLSKDIFLENANTQKVLRSMPPDYQYIVAPHVAKECLSRTLLFKGCSPQFISLLLEQLSLESYGVGEVLFQIGDVSDSVYIIKTGFCLLVNERKTVISELSDTDIFGEVSCFMSAPRTYTCVCSKFCELYVLRVPQLVKIFRMFPDFMIAFQMYCRRKILVDASAKLQLPSVFHDSSQVHLLSHPTFSQSPSLSSRQPIASPVQSSDLLPLKPLPKGKYRAPIVPDLPEIMHLRVTQSTRHAERVRLVAEIQVNCVSPYVHYVSMQLTIFCSLLDGPFQFRFFPLGRRIRQSNECL